MGSSAARHAYCPPAPVLSAIMVHQSRDISAHMIAGLRTIGGDGDGFVKGGVFRCAS